MIKFDAVGNPLLRQQTDLTLSEAATEFAELRILLGQKKFGHGGDGWANPVKIGIQDRMSQLRVIITDIVCEQNKKKVSENHG